MANVILSKATGNFLTNTTWGLVDATSYLNSESGNTALTTSYVYTQLFAPGAIEIDGIAVKLASRAASPTGTITLQLYNDSDTAEVKTVTLNVSDLPTCNTTYVEGGWIFFKFDAATTLIAGKNYKIGMLTSSSSQVNLYRDGTAGNWSRMLRGTADQAPGVGDTIIVAGEHTGAGTGNDITVTMNNIDTTDYGNASTTLESLGICKRGILTWGVTASTNYNLRLSGLLIVFNGGTYNQGTVATPMPSTCTAKLEFDCAADGDFGFVARNGSTVVMQGNPLTYDRCLLASDEAVNSTEWTTSVETGWKDNDEIAIASTTRTYNQCEKGALNGDASGTTLTVDGFGGAGGGLAYAHSGTTKTQAEIINLTRNVKITNVTAAAITYVYLAPTASINFDWTEISYIGVASGIKHGIYIDTTTGSCDIQNCSIHDSEAYLFNLPLSTNNNIVISNNVTFKHVNYGIKIVATSGTSITLNNNCIMGGSGTNSNGIFSADAGIIITNNTIAGMGAVGLTINESGSAVFGTKSGNTIHSNNGISFDCQYLIDGTISSTTIWYGNTTGLRIDRCGNIIYNILDIYGCNNRSIILDRNNFNILFKTLTEGGVTSYATDVGIDSGTLQGIEVIRIEDSLIGSATDIYTTHSTADIRAYGGFECVLNNVTLGSTEETSIGTSYFVNGSYIQSQRNDKTEGNNKTYVKYGIISQDSSFYNTATPSARLTPNSASYKLESAPLGKGMKVAVDSGESATINVYVRKSQTAGGPPAETAYNGNQPRLIVRKNIAAGITSDTVLDTAAGAAGNWEQLTGTTAAVSEDCVLEFIVDADGTAGWVNIDDWSKS